MNTKTTLILVVMLGLLGMLYYVVETRPDLTQATNTPSPAAASSLADHELIEQELGDVVKVTCQRKDGDEWIFEKEAPTTPTGQPVWRMTAPLTMTCASYEVGKFGSRLGRLTYELSYKPGEPGAVTAAQAGLDPPNATVTLGDADGNEVTVEIGHPAPGRKTYVRLGGSEEICVAGGDLSDLIKEKPLDYRDKQFWSFDASNATRVEIVDRSSADSPVSYVFAKDGARWMMESPVTAQATGKVDEMLRTMARMRATGWHDDDAGRLVRYGLENPTLTVRATVVEEVPIEDDADQETTVEAADEDADEDESAPEPKFEKKTSIYELHLSDRSPIGEDTKTYARLGDEFAVATISKSQADKFQPVMSKWREMRIITADVGDATRIELTTPEGAAVLVKKDGAWSFDPDGGRAEMSVVSALLSSISGLSAVAFVDQDPVDLASFGLDKPQSEIELTVPGVEGSERIAVGSYTHKNTKRLIYVRRNDLASVAKVRAADLSTLIQGPQVYRDRTVVEILPSRYERITLSTRAKKDAGVIATTLLRGEDVWRMVDPVEAPLRQEQVDKLVETLGGLRAQQVVAEAGEPSSFGLHDPAITIALTYKPPVEYRIEPETNKEPEVSDDPGSATEPGETGDAPASSVPVAFQPPSKVITLSVTEHDGKCYATRSDRPTIYEMSKSFYQQLLAEYRTDRVLEFDSDAVQRFAIRTGDQTHEFARQEERWIYQAEPDLPLDKNKVDDLLLRLGDLRTSRYVSHTESDLNGFGLASPDREVRITLDDGTERILWVSSNQGTHGPDAGYYAAVKQTPGVFLLAPDTVARFKVSLAELETSD